MSRQTRLAPAQRIEARALLLSLGGLGLGLLIGLASFWDSRTPLFGQDSVGQAAAITGAGVTLFAFPLAYWPSISAPQEWVTPAAPRLSLPKRVLDTVGLTLAHSAIMLLGILTAFALIQGAFVGAELDAWAASAGVGLATSVAAYFAFLSGARVSSSSLAVVFVVFLTSGAVASMLTSSNPEWWKYNLSVLGVPTAASSFTFNATMCLSGLVMSVLADYLTNDIDLVARRHTHYRAWKTVAVRWAFVSIGLCLVVVGLIPVDVSLLVHNIAAKALGVIFIGLLALVPVLLPHFSRVFLVTSWIIALALVLATGLYYFGSYYNLTGYELLSASLIFSWIIVLVRTAAAAANGSDGA
jgi:hypothetical protein